MRRGEEAGLVQPGEETASGALTWVHGRRRDSRHKLK